MKLWKIQNESKLNLKRGKANKMTEKIIISKELNEWLEGHQTLDTDDTIYSKRFG